MFVRPNYSGENSFTQMIPKILFRGRSDYFKASEYYSEMLVITLDFTIFTPR
jgi:hypothetical protein